MHFLSQFLVLCVLVPLWASAAGMKGIVVDAEGEPVAGASVWLTQERVVKQASSGSEGTFRFSEVNVGFATVVAWKQGLACGGVQGVFVDDAEVEISLGPPGSLKLRVLSSRYEPIAGARVKSMFVNGAFTVPLEDLTPHGFPALRSNDDGMILTDLIAPDGFVQLVVTQHAYAEAYVAYLPVDDAQHEVILETGVALTGRVQYGTVPVPKAVVKVDQLSTAGPVRMTETLADPEGFYNLRLPAGTYWVAADHVDYAPADPQEVVLQADQVTVGLEVRQPRTISGTIETPSGKGAGGVRVEFRRNGIAHAQSLSRQNGKFVLETGYGQGTLFVQPPDGYVVDTFGGIEIDMKDETQVTLKPLRLEEIPAVFGVVKDDTGAPLANAFVSLYGGQMPLIALTNEEGQFRLQLSVFAPDAGYELRVEHPVRFLRVEREVDPSKAKPLDLQLKPFEPNQEPRALGQNALSLAPLAGKPAPALECDAWFNTQPLTLESLKGKVVVLTFWGGFDQGPYGLTRLLELNSLYALFQRSAVDDVVFVGVHDASVEPEEVEEYLAQYRIEWPVGCDADPFKTFVTYGINFIPQTVLIDKQGILRYHDVEGRLLELIKVLRRKS